MNIVEEQVRFTAEGLRLEGILAYPEEYAPDTAVCLLAPHPFFGGDLANNVIKHLAQSLAACGAVTLRFNYRGVGESEMIVPESSSRFACFEAMENERRYEVLVPDAVAAMDFLCNALPDATRRILIGYSFGAVLAGMAAPHTRATELVGISPPITRVPLDAYQDSTLPKLFLAGDRDFVFDERIFLASFEKMRDPKQWVPLPGHDHFHRGREQDLLQALLKVLGDFSKRE